MENYEVLGILGEGTYGVVMKARSRLTGKLVAIKRFKQTDEDEHVRKTSTREVRMLQQLKHPNVVSLEDVFRREGKLHLVFEYIENTILQVLETTTHGIPPRELRRYTYQLLRGIAFCHSHNVIHRDVKPENVLIDQNGMLKLCDFGFARQMTSKGKYTDYVATRWYRAPELLVGDVAYGKPVDVWALGCMFAELSDGQPLFPGESDLDQLCLIIQTCGPVPDRMVTIFEHNPLYRNVTYPHTGIVYTLQERYHRQSEDWLEFLYACLHPDPARRLTCSELMALPYFTRDGFRDRYEQELRALSGLPLLRTNPTASAPTPTLRTVTTKPTAKPKNVLDATILARTNANAEPVAPPSSKKRQTTYQKSDISKGSNTDSVKAKPNDSDNGSCPPNAVPTDGSVKLPLILSQSTDKSVETAAATVAVASQEEALAQSSPTHRRSSNPLLLGEAGAVRTSRPGSLTASEPVKGKPISKPFSAVLSSRRTSFTSSVAVSPVKKAETIAISDSTCMEINQQLSNMVINGESSDGIRRTPGSLAITQLTNPREVAAAAAAGAAAGAGAGAGAGAENVTRGGPAADSESKRTSRSSLSNASPPASLLCSTRNETKLVLYDAEPSFDALCPSTTATDVAVNTSTMQPHQQHQHQPHLTPLLARLPDLTSPELQLPTKETRSSTDMGNIPKPPSQPPSKPPSQSLYPSSPISANASTFNQPFLNPLAVPPSHERSNVKRVVPKVRRGASYDSSVVPMLYAKKKLTKRKKESTTRSGSHDSSSLSSTHCNPQMPDSSRSLETREQEKLDSTLEEKQNRMYNKFAGSNTTATIAAVKRNRDMRVQMPPHKERKSKPLQTFTHATSREGDSRTLRSLSQQQQPLQHQPPHQPQPQLDPALQRKGSELEQHASATLLALSALRDSTSSLHQPFSHDAGILEKYPFSHHMQAAGSGADYVVPPPPKTQAKEGCNTLQSKTTIRARKPPGVYSLRSSRRSVDEDEARNSTLRGHDANKVVSQPSGQYTSFALPYHRTSKAGSNDGAPPTTSYTPTATAQSLLASKKPRKNGPSIGDDVKDANGSRGMSYTSELQKDFQSSPAQTSTASQIDKSTRRRRENSGSSRKGLPLVYNAATAATKEM